MIKQEKGGCGSGRIRKIAPCEALQRSEDCLSERVTRQGVVI